MVSIDIMIEVLKKKFLVFIIDIINFFEVEVN